MTLLLELNDAHLSLYRDGAAIYRQPAVAHLSDAGNRFGEAAMQLARLHPQQTNDQYLSRLNADPLSVTGKQAANHADLVYLHLLEVKPLVPEDIVIAVPGTLTNDQLGVLLGIAEEAGVKVSGFVDTAVLMASAVELPTDAWVLDLHQNLACVTELEVGDAVQKQKAEGLLGCGLMSCVDSWANLLADRFVHDTRFDPLHAADTEQQLYDQIYTWTQGRDIDDDFAIEIMHNDHARRVQVTGAALQSKLNQRFKLLAQKLPSAATVMVSPRSAALPGLLGALDELGVHATTIADDALTTGFARHAEDLAQGAPRLVTELAYDHDVRKPAPRVTGATHVLSGNRAYPLASNPFGLPAEGKSGDVISKDGNSYQLIVVER